MKYKIYTLVFASILSSGLTIKAQSSAYLDINNANALINGSGYLFTNFTSGGVAAFEVPKGSGKSTIFSSNLWIAGYEGLEAGGQLYLTAPTYRQGGVDCWSGPLDTVTAGIDSTTSAQWNLVWKVNKSTIDSFKLGLNNGIPSSIANWPGNGNTSKGQAKRLAPFYDKNGNGLYEPISGDYPLIKGDQAVYFIYNDETGSMHTESGGAPLGLEIHGMAYAFNCSQDTAMMNTIFLHYDVINRSNVTYTNTQIGSWTDTDIGYYGDDFIGCDTVLNTYFGCNGTTIDGLDGPSGGAGVYGANPPANGTVSLDLPLTDFISFNNDFTVQGNPIDAAEFDDYLNAEWLDGSPLTYGGNGINGSKPTKFMFPTDPSDAKGWSESISRDTPGDRRGVAALGNSFSFSPGATKSFDLAYVFGRDTTKTGTNITSVNNLKQNIRSVQKAFNNNMTSCGETLTGIKEINKSTLNEVTLYPNPGRNTLTIQLGAVMENSTLEVYDVTGALVMKELGNQTLQQKIDISNLNAGLYFLRIANSQLNITNRFVKQ